MREPCEVLEIRYSPCGSRLGRWPHLFDRHRQPRDQARDLFQILGIVLPDGLCEPAQAFLIAYRGFFDGTIEGSASAVESGCLALDHLLGENPGAAQIRLRISRFAAMGGCGAVSRDGHDAARRRPFLARPEPAKRSCGHKVFRQVIESRAASGTFPPLQGPVALLYAAHSRTSVSPVPR